jgi:UDP-GlcNAc:undecaprenyl-phosphate GlcNAc-1-phosphate transferase
MIKVLALLGGIAFCLSYLFSVVSRQMAFRTKAIAVPSGRRQHKQPTPQLGGLGIGAALLLLLVVGTSTGLFIEDHIQIQQLIGFGMGILILMIVGVLDDIYDWSASTRFSWYALASLIVVLAGTSVRAITCLDGQACSLEWWQSARYAFGPLQLQLSFPGDILAWVWLFLVTFTTKLLDGLDGLVTGQTMIGAFIILLLTLTPFFFQPAVAFLAIVVLGAYAGFLPKNFPPAKQFLGESGSVLAGFSLAFLSLVSGAKMAMAFLALGLPLIDMLIVVFDRVRTGHAPWVGDRTHLHFRLQDDAGLSSLQAVLLLWTLSFLFGTAALLVKTEGKILLAICVVLVTIGLRLWCSVRRSRLVLH